MPIPTRLIPLAAFGALIVCAFGGIPIIERLARPVSRWIDADARGKASSESVRAAFQGIVALPGSLFVLAIVAWPVGQRAQLLVAGFALAAAIGALTPWPERSLRSFGTPSSSSRRA